MCVDAGDRRLLGRERDIDTNDLPVRVGPCRDPEPGAAERGQQPRSRKGRGERPPPSLAGRRRRRRGAVRRADRIARAGFVERPSEAAGMTEAMWTLFARPYGQVLLGGVAAGLMCFGVFQLLHARYARL